MKDPEESRFSCVRLLAAAAPTEITDEIECATDVHAMMPNMSVVSLFFGVRFTWLCSDFLADWHADLMVIFNLQRLVINSTPLKILK